MIETIRPVIIKTTFWKVKTVKNTSYLKRQTGLLTVQQLANKLKREQIVYVNSISLVNGYGAGLMLNGGFETENWEIFDSFEKAQDYLQKLLRNLMDEVDNLVYAEDLK